jgi:hypothetical protein
LTLKELMDRAADLGVEEEAEMLLSDWLDQVEDALDTYDETHWGDEGDGEITSALLTMPQVLVKLGELARIEYETVKKGDGLTRYYHDFEDVRPVLAFDPETKDLWITGGDYSVTARGIEG